MSWLEQELRSSMKRRTPPPGFADRVLTRVNARQPAKRFDWQWAAAIAASIVIAAGGYGYRQEQRRQEAERVQAEVRLAFEITQEKLELVKTKLSKFGLKGEI